MSTTSLAPKGFIFDLDGTLLDTEPLYTEATQKVMDPIGRRFTLEFKRTIVGREAMESANMTVSEYDLPMDAQTFLDRRSVFLKVLFPAAQPITGAETFIEGLLDQDVPIAIATSSSREMFELKRSQKPWLQKITTTLCGDEVRRSKPDPEIFVEAANALGISAADSIVFEDSITGFKAARAAGMTVIGIDSPYLLDVDRTEANLVIDDYQGLAFVQGQLFVGEGADPDSA